MRVITNYIHNHLRIIIWILFWILVGLNILDVTLTYYGVNVLKVFGEGNCYLKSYVESGNYTIPILFKISALSLAVFGWIIIDRKKYRNRRYTQKYIAFFMFLFVVIIYLITITKWIVEIMFYHLSK